MPIARVPQLAIASRTPSEVEFHPGRGATSSRQSRMNRGTLNIFTGEYGNGTRDAAAEASARGMTRFSAINLETRRHYHNRESQESREFPSACIRHVRLSEHSEPVHGIKHISDTPCSKQQIQVVNITPAYADPANMQTPRPSLRCMSNKGRTDELKSILAYQRLGENQLKGSLGSTPLGKPRTNDPRRVINYTRPERFFKAVCEHVHQRVGGIAGFYVLLARGTIGDVVPSVPKTPLRDSRSEGEQQRRVLTLGRCRDQLVYLIGISVTLLELADLIWGPQRQANLVNLSEEELVALDVPFKHFAAAFGTNLFETSFQTRAKLDLRGRQVR